MVRALIGASLIVGTEHDPHWLHERLLAQVRDSQTKLAAPHPLVLEHVAYPEDHEMTLRAEQTRAMRG
jgi:tRNA pseudouridine38-40 synthase